MTAPKIGAESGDAASSKRSPPSLLMIISVDELPKDMSDALLRWVAKGTYRASSGSAAFVVTWSHHTGLAVGDDEARIAAEWRLHAAPERASPMMRRMVSRIAGCSYDDAVTTDLVPSVSIDALIDKFIATYDPGQRWMQDFEALEHFMAERGT